MNKKPCFIMLVGIPGSGKDSWLKKQHPAVKKFTVISIDNMRKEVTGNISDQACNSIVWASAKTWAKSALLMGNNIILNATNVNTMYRRDFIQGLPPCQKMARVFLVKPEVAYERIKKSLAKGTDRARVPEEAVYKMYGEFLYTVKNLKAEGFKIITTLPKVKK